MTRKTMVRQGECLSQEPASFALQKTRGTIGYTDVNSIQNSFNILPRQALHARSLAFDHPVSGKRLEFEVPIPADMQEALERWRTYIKGRQSID